MTLSYSIAELLQLKHISTPPCPMMISAISEHGLLQRPKYIHPSSGRKFVYSRSGHSISSIWYAARTDTPPPFHHHNNQHVHSACLRPLPKAPQPVQTQPHLKLALFNTRSLNNKGLILNEFITDNNLDFLCITETWQKPRPDNTHRIHIY